MAIAKTVETTGLILEVSGGYVSGKEVWRRKTFNGVKTEALAEDILEVARAIQAVIGSDTRGFHLQQKVLLTEVN